MGRPRTGFVWVLIAVMALVAGACGDSSGGDAAPTAATGSNAPSPAGDVADAPADTAAPTDAPAGTTPGESQGGDLSLVPAGETDILGNPAGQGFVVFDGVRYDFLLNGTCRNVFGGLQVGGELADGSDGRVDSFIPPENWESAEQASSEWDPPLVDIDIGGDSWRAQAGSQHFFGGAQNGALVDLTPEQSSVTSFTNDGSRVTGEAIFYSTFNVETLETAIGSFEFYCP